MCLYNGIIFCMKERLQKIYCGMGVAYWIVIVKIKYSS